MGILTTSAWYAFIVSFLLFIFEIIALFNSGFSAEKGVLLTGLIISMVFLVSSIIERHYNKREQIRVRWWDMAGNTLVMGCVACWLAATFWDGRVANLFPANFLLTGQNHLDAMFSITLSQALKNYHVSSILINGTTYFEYHYGSFILLALLSVITSVSPMNVLYFISPVLIFPLFFFIFFKLIKEFRIYKGISKAIRLTDMLFLFVFIAGFLPLRIQDDAGFQLSSCFISISAGCGLTMFLLIIWFSLRCYNRQWFKVKYFFLLYVYILMPLMIFCCSALKISTSFMLLIMVCGCGARMGRSTFERIFWPC